MPLQKPPSRRQTPSEYVSARRNRYTTLGVLWGLPSTYEKASVSIVRMPAGKLTPYSYRPSIASSHRLLVSVFSYLFRWDVCALTEFPRGHTYSLSFLRYIRSLSTSLFQRTNTYRSFLPPQATSRPSIPCDFHIIQYTGSCLSSIWTYWGVFGCRI